MRASTPDTFVSPVISNAAGTAPVQFGTPIFLSLFFSPSSNPLQNFQDTIWAPGGEGTANRSFHNGHTSASR